MSDFQALDISNMSLERLPSETVLNSSQSQLLIPINTSHPFSNSLTENIGHETNVSGNFDLDSSIPIEDNVKSMSLGSTSANKRSKRPGPPKPKPSSALMQAKQNAQLRIAKANASAEISFIVKDHLQPARDAKEIIRKETAIIYDRRMVEHRSPWDPNHPEKPERFSSIMQRCEALKLFERCLHVAPRHATEKEILSLHTKEHMNKLLDMSTNYVNDMDTLEEFSSTYDSVYFHPSTYELALLSCGCTIDLVNSILAGKAQNGMAIIRPPGHHAMKAEFCGYCYFNNVAIAAHSALSNGSANKILIVDFDVHHGQATQQMFYDDPRVLYFSTHRYEHGMFWPNLEESNYHWIGDQDGLGYNCNIPLNEIGMGNSEFLSIWHHVLMPLAYQFNPDLVIVSAGYDAALGCPEGQMEVTPQCYPHLISPLMGLANGKIAVILEGGYCLKSLSEGAALTLKTLLGDPCPIIKPISNPNPIIVETILNSIYMLRKHWDFGTHHTLNNDNGSPVENEYDESRLHTPSVKFEWNQPKMTKFPTRNCHPTVNEETTAALDLALDRLILNTSLIKARHRVGLVYDDIMLKHRNMTDPGHPERPERISNIFACHADYGLIERCHRIESRKATNEELRLIHTEKHILKMRNTQKFGSSDLSNMQNTFNSIYLNNNTYESALYAAGSVLQVVDKVLNGECQSGVAIVRPPGHHAESNEPCGFCIFNNVALAAKYALDVHDMKRILILDWDVHHGNGIQRMFEDDPRVLYISIHRYDWATFFPCSTDADFTSVGIGKGEGFNVNIPWNKNGMGDTEYLYAFNNIVLPIAYEFAPELVLVSSGFDAAKGDLLGGCKVTPEGYAHMTHLLSPLANGKLVLALEGGYNLTTIAYSMSLCTKALLGDPIPPLTLNASVNESARSSVNNVLRIHAKYWNVLSPFQKVLPESELFTSGKYRTESQADDTTITKLLENLNLVSHENVDDSVNANSTVHIIPDPPPASGEPSLSFPSPQPRARISGLLPPQESQITIGGGENTIPISEPARAQPDTDEILEGAVGGSNNNVQTIQDAYQIMVNTNITDRDAKMYVVSPLPWCPHMETVCPVPNNEINCLDPCQDCLSSEENWICLTCYSIFCSRYVREHMVMHSIDTGHQVALSFSDISVWCYACNAYIDCEILNSAKSAAYRSKFGEELPLPTAPSTSQQHS